MLPLIKPELESPKKKFTASPSLYLERNRAKLFVLRKMQSSQMTEVPR